MKNYYSRKFLNKLGNHTTASIYSEVESDSYGGISSTFVTGQIEVRDCSNEVHLSLDFNTKEELDNNLYKVRTMMEELSKLEEYLVKNNGKFVELIEKEKG